MWVGAALPQLVMAYVIAGRIIVWYTRSLYLMFRCSFLSNGYNWTKAIVPIFFRLSVWVFQVSFRSKLGPRYLAVVDHVTGCPLTISLRFGNLCLLLKQIACTFSWFMAIFQLSSHLVTLLSPLCSLTIALLVFRDCAPSAVSSANRALNVCSLSGMSYMYILYSTGPRTDPCGTPAYNLLLVDRWPSSLTWNSLPSKNERMILICPLGRSSRHILAISPSCQTL